MALGLFLLSRMDSSTTVAAASFDMLVLGLGLGLVMQVLVIVVQNSVDYRDLGVATSGATLFRLIGGSLGTAVFGALFTARLAAQLAGALPPGTLAAGGLSPQKVAALPPHLRAVFTQAFTDSLDTVFLAAAGVALVGFLLTWLIPETPLRETVAATAADVGTEASRVFPMPTDADSVSRLERALSLIASRDVKRAYIERAVARAGVDLTPAAAWLLVRLEEEPELDPRALEKAHAIEPGIVDAALAELEAKGLLAGRRATEAGCAVLEKLVDARRSHLTELLAEWGPAKREELAARVRQLSHELVRDAPAAPAG
jgi:DNA-binding MarR family transcriptional regulator